MDPRRARSFGAAAAAYDQARPSYPPDALRWALPMVRVLRPGGTVGLLWNLLDDGAPWVAELVDLWSAEDRASFARMEHPPPFGPAPQTITAGSPA